MGVVKIGLSYPSDYHKSNLRDTYGNRALVEGTFTLNDESKRSAWDVVFQVNMEP